MLARRVKFQPGPQSRHARRIRHARAALEAPDNNIAGGPFWSARQRRLNPSGCGRRLRWGNGYATFGVRWVLPFAFTNLRLGSVWAESLATNRAAHRVLGKLGFVESGERAHGEERWPADEPLVRFTITPAQWRARRDAPALAALHPTLRALLERELAAGNQIRETNLGWPDADSVVVTLRDDFRALPEPLPEGVTHGEPNDPHWWRAEVVLREPRQMLVW